MAKCKLKCKAKGKLKCKSSEGVTVNSAARLHLREARPMLPLCRSQIRRGRLGVCDAQSVHPDGSPKERRGAARVFFFFETKFAMAIERSRAIVAACGKGVSPRKPTKGARAGYETDRER